MEQQKRLLNISGELKSSKAQVSSLEKEVMDGMLRGMVRAKIAEAEVSWRTWKNLKYLTLILGP